jgi:predicted PurR-regulated permease PerM
LRSTKRVTDAPKKRTSLLTKIPRGTIIFMKSLPNQPITISITAGTIIKLIAIGVMFWLLWTIRELVLVILTAIVIASAVNPAARFLTKHRIPRVIAVILIYAVIIAVMLGFFAVFLPPLVKDIEQLVQTLPQYIETLSNDRLADLPGLSPLLERVGDSENTIIGVPNPMFLALIAAVFELIPIFGPILAAVPAVIFALIDGGLTLGLITVGLYAIIQQFESQLIHPLVVKKIVGIPALVAIVALIIGAQVAGFLGIILSVPVAAAIMEFVSDVDKQKSKQLAELEQAAQEK